MRRSENTTLIDMPIYEYRCGDCGHEFETIQKISDDPLKVCPACKESTLVKKISAAGFRLKGGGWYETDFKSGNKRNLSADSKPDSGGGSDSAAGASSKTGGESKSVGSKSDSSAKPAASSSSKSSDAS